MISLAAVLVTTLWLIPTAIVASRLIRALETRHRRVWEELGRPNMLMTFAATTPGYATRLRGFVRRGEYKSLRDTEVNRLVRALRVCEFVGLCLFTATVVLILSGY